MQAFSKNIDALEKMLDDFFQKWEKLQEENKLLIQRNKQLEEELKRVRPGEKQQKSTNNRDQPQSAFDPIYIINAIDQYVVDIDDCIEKINIELDE